MVTPLHYRDFESMTFGLRDGSPSDDHVFNEMFIGDSYRIIDRKLSGVVFDVGCNIGLFSCLAASRGADRVVSFEPEPSNYELAKQNIESNGFGDIVELHPFGLGAEVGLTKLVYGHGNSFVPAEGRDISGLELVDIHLELMDDFLHGQEVSFLKMDIEGSETSVIPGSQYFKTNVLEFAMEHHGINQAWFDMIASMVGYFDVTIESHPAPDHPYGGMMYGTRKNADS